MKFGMQVVGVDDAMVVLVGIEVDITVVEVAVVVEVSVGELIGIGV